MNLPRNGLPGLFTSLTIILSLFCSMTIAVVLPVSMRPRALASHPAVDLTTTTTPATKPGYANGVRDVVSETFTPSPFLSAPTTPIIGRENAEAFAASSVTPATTTPVPISSPAHDITNLEARDGSSTTTPTSSSSSSSPTSTDGPQPGNINVQVWAPLVGIVAVIALLVLYTCFRKNSMNASMVAATRTANDAAAAGTSTSGAVGQTRRRPRRTPSQVSTRSLPAYMMDPGEQEIVLERGGLRRNRSRPEMGQDMEDDDEYDEEDMDMDMDNDYDPNGRASQADRPLLDGSPTHNGLIPPNGHSRRSTIDTINVGSEDSHRGLLRDADADEMHDEHAGGEGMTYVFGEGTTGGQLQVYDEHERGEEEHVEMSELGGGVFVGRRGSASRHRSATSGQGSSPTSPPRRHAGPTQNGGAAGTVSGFFSSFSTLLTNSFTSIAQSLSGMNVPGSGSTVGVGGGGGGAGGTYGPIADQRQRALSPPRTTTTTTTGGSSRRNRSENGSTSAFLAPSTPAQPPPPYEGGNAAGSRSSTDTARGRDRSRSRSSPRPSFSTAANSSTTNTNPSSSTLSLHHAHARTASSSNLPSNSSGSTTSLTISAPLAHTVTKSTFKYPASGPTTEQIKFLSSREALGKYGAPYGEEAVAAAKAAARGGGSGAGAEAEEPPPPSFEDVTGAGTSASGSGSGAGQMVSSPTSISGSNLASSTTISSTTSTSTFATAPARADSLASRASIRSNRGVISGPRGPRNSVRKSTLPQGVGGMENERTPRPSMDSVDTVDSFGIELRRRRDRRDSGGGGERYWDASAEVESPSQSQSQAQTPQIQIQTQPQSQPPQRRSNLPKLTIDPVSPIGPILLTDDTSSASSTTAIVAPTRSRSQKPQIIPKTAPKGFVMSSPPPSPTPTTSTFTHARTVSASGSTTDHELGVPFITFAPATPSGEGDSVVGHESGRGFA